MIFCKYIKKKSIAFLLTGALITTLPVSVCTNTVYAKSTKDKIKEAEELKKQTQQAKEATEDKKEGLQDQKHELKSYLDKLNSDLADISIHLVELEDQMLEKQAEIEATKADLYIATEEAKNQYALMKKRIKFMYEKGDASMIDAFLSAKSYSDFLNKAEYVNKIEDYDLRMYQNLVTLKESIQVREAELEEEEANLQLLKDQARVEEAKVNSMVETTNGSIAKTEGAISAVELEEAAYEAELKIQEDNLESLRNQLAIEQAMISRAANMSWRDISEVTFESSDRDLLACLIYCEAGNQPYEGQVAVGAVVINRMRSAAFPNTMVGVIYQNRQFSPVASGRLATRLSLGANEQCYRAADEAMSGATPVGNCLYFRTVIPEINGQIIGGHVFY